MAYLRIWQSLFFTLLICTIVLAIYIAPAIKIDTNLGDISPSTEHSIETRFATDELRKNIEQRIIFLISGDDEDTVELAEEQLRLDLSGLPNIELQASNDALAETLLSKLAPYRFSLSSKKQQQRLSNKPAEDIAKQAKLSLYSLSGQAQIYPFNEDPLAWHSETLLSLLPDDVESDSIYTSVGVSIKSGALNMRSQQTLSKEFNDISRKLLSTYEIEIDRSGIFFFASAAAQSSKKDISLISTGSTLGVVLLLLFVFRSVRALLLPVASIFLGVGFAFVLSHMVYGQVHILTIVFGASLIGIVIDYSLHYFYHGAVGNSDEKSSLFRALSLSLITSVIGYAALSFSSLLALQKVALFSCCGLFMAWLSVICLGDIALRKPLKTEQTLLPALVSALRSLNASLPKGMTLTLVAITLGLGAYIAIIAKPFNDDPRVFFKPDAALLASERNVAQVTSDYEPGRYIIVHGNSVEHVYSRHEQLISAIKQHTEIDASQLTSLMTWVPSPTRQANIYTAQSKLYADGGAADLLYASLNKPDAAQTVKTQYQNAKQRTLSPKHASEILGSGLPPIWFEGEQNVVSFVLIQKGVQADELQAPLERIDGVSYVNTLKATQAALTSQRLSASALLLVAYCLIAILMVLRNRTLLAASIVLVPLGASAMLFICAVIFGFELNLFHIMALFLVLGFGMDYGIFANEMREHSNVTLQAILLSAITSLLSFGLLALSDIPVVASFGNTLLIGNLFNLLGVFVYTRVSQPN